MTDSSTERTTARLLIIGPPGAGKGTQASRIAERYGVPAISTGDIFRANIKGGTELGRRVQAIIEAGELVPDSLTNEIVADRLAQADAANGFLLDGYPRTVDQVHALDGMLEGSSLDAVVLLEADTDEVVARLLKRAELEGRADDTEAVIRHRQEVYAEQTAPLIELFSERGILVSVDGLGTVDEVAERIASGLDARLSATAGR
ncbi:adenylate kinase [Leucobacter celer]|uniref:adenylate kinase n=1 Tax=Leucobacter celer TaxID=668625 RepID=UPI0006A7E947|nr:adenylate kinase [Leucobacter celer]